MSLPPEFLASLVYLPLHHYHFLVAKITTTTPCTIVRAGNCAAASAALVRLRRQGLKLELLHLHRTWGELGAAREEYQV
jgi:hypothetical protein